MLRRVSSKAIAYKRHTLKRDRNQFRIALLPQINRAEADIHEMYLSTTDGRSEEGRRRRVGNTVALRLDHVTVYRPRFFFSVFGLAAWGNRRISMHTPPLCSRSQLISTQ